MRDGVYWGVEMPEESRKVMQEWRKSEKLYPQS